MTKPEHNIEWLSQSPVQRPRLAFLGRWTVPVRMRLLRMKQWIFGPAQTIAIDGMIFELSAVAAADLVMNKAGLTNSAGVRAFVIEDGGGLRDELLVTIAARKANNNLLSSPRVITADGMQAQFASYETVSIGSSTNVQRASAGWWVDVWPRVSGRSTDVACFVTQTERVLQRVSSSDVEITNIGFIRTNISAGARVRIPEHGSLFLLSPPTRTNGSALGILLSPTVQKRPGR